MEIRKSEKVTGKEGIWRITDSQGDVYYAKRVSAAELTMTMSASSFSRLAEDAVLVMPRVTSTDISILPGALISEITQFKFESDAENSTRQGFMLVRSVPEGVIIGDERPEAFSVPLRGKPITHREFERLLHDLKTMNDAHIHNGDIISNLQLARDEQGRLRAYCYDFDPTAGGLGLAGNALAPNDAADLSLLQRNLEKMGTLETHGLKHVGETLAKAGITVCNRLHITFPHPRSSQTQAQGMIKPNSGPLSL